MDLFALLRTLGGLAFVLGLLTAALWVVRRYDIKLPGRVGAGSGKRLELIERLPLDGRRSAALIRRDGREHLILIGPDGTTIVEAGIVKDELDLEAEAARKAAEEERAIQAAAEAAAMRESFATMVERASDGVRKATENVRKASDGVIKASEGMREGVIKAGGGVRERVRRVRTVVEAAVQQDFSQRH